MPGAEVKPVGRRRDDLCGTDHSSASLNTNGAPQSGSPAAAAYKNLTSICTGVLAPLCNNISGIRRPTSGPWTAGAY